MDEGSHVPSRALSPRHEKPRSSALTDFHVAGCPVPIRWPFMEQSVSPAKKLLAQGSLVSRVLLVTEGSVKYSFIERSGREFIAQIRSAGCIVGLESALTGTPAPFSVTTLTECKLHPTNTDLLRDLMINNPLVAYSVAQAIAFEALSHKTHLIDIVAGSTRERLIALLSQQQAGPTGTGVATRSAWQPLKKYEIAKLLGVTPEYLSRLLRALKHEGIIESQQRRLALRHASARG